MVAPYQVREREYREHAPGLTWPKDKPKQYPKKLPDGSLVRSEKQDKPAEAFDWDWWI